MKARFPGKCSECNEDIVKGKEIAKNEDGDWVHKHCVDEVLEMPLFWLITKLYILQT